jgi:hypothetical protein
MYNVIDIESSTPILDDNGNVRIFDTIQDAMLTVNGLFAITGKKYKPKQIIDDSWHEREQNKYNIGEYKLPFWVNVGSQFDMFFYQSDERDENTGNRRLVWNHSYGPTNLKKYKTSVIQENIKIEFKKEHYLHVSKLDSTKIAFTENESKGMNDRQTQMNVSKYLIQYYGLDNELAKYINSLHEREYKKLEVYLKVRVKR